MTRPRKASRATKSVASKVVQIELRNLVDSQVVARPELLDPPTGSFENDAVEGIDVVFSPILTELGGGSFPVIHGYRRITALRNIIEAQESERRSPQ